MSVSSLLTKWIQSRLRQGRSHLAGTRWADAYLASSPANGDDWQTVFPGSANLPAPETEGFLAFRMVCHPLCIWDRCDPHHSWGHMNKCHWVRHSRLHGTNLRPQSSKSLGLAQRGSWYQRACSSTIPDPPFPNQCFPVVCSELLWQPNLIWSD